MVLKYANFITSGHTAGHGLPHMRLVKIIYVIKLTSTTKVTASNMDLIKTMPLKSTRLEILKIVKRF